MRVFVVMYTCTKCDRMWLRKYAIDGDGSLEMPNVYCPDHDYPSMTASEPKNWEEMDDLVSFDDTVQVDSA